MRAVKISSPLGFNPDSMWISSGPAEACIYMATEKSECVAYGMTGWIEVNVPLNPGDQLYITDECKLEVRPYA